VAIIILTALIIISFAVASGIVFVGDNIEEALETDLRLVADIADQFVTGEISLLKNELTTVALRIEEGGEEDFHEILERQLAFYPQFSGIAAFDPLEGLIGTAGPVPAGREILGEAFMARAFEGSSIISTTMKNAAGLMVMYVAVPMGSGVLTGTLPAMYFSDRLAAFTIWETGHIFIDDAEGYVIANIRPEWVHNRINFIKLAENDPQYQSPGQTVERMIRGEAGVARFSVEGEPRICAYRPITGSHAGWSLGVVAPLEESPARNVNRAIMLVGMVGLGLSIIAALVAANFIIKPYDEAARLKEIAEAASQAKTSFLASMSHEMRTPLNAVIGLSELTLGGEISGDDRKNIEKIYNSGMNLLGIVNDILDLSKIESGKFELIPVEYDLPSFINDTVTLNIIRIGSKPIKFHLHIDGTLPTRLYGDDLRIKQIFNNLLSNAFKYTRQGTVEWFLSSRREGDNVWLTGTIRDTGIGIKAKDLDKLFADYHRVDVQKNHAIEGTGLGLAITKRMVEMMDGAITVESEYGKGSSFTVRLRQKAAGEGLIGDEVAGNLMAFRYLDSKRSHNNKMVRIKLPYARVLVVDDVASNLDVARGILKPYEIQVDCVMSGQEAVDLIREGKVRYNAIFMDHMMPCMDGIEAVRIIREEIGTDYAKNIPIIALTANAIIGNEGLFLSRGFQEFLSKPIDVMAMDAAVRRWVRDKSRENGLELPEAEEEGEEQGPPVFAGKKLEGLDIEDGLRRFGGNGENYRDILRSFLKNTPPVIIKLTEPREETLPDYAIAVHGLKGSSRSIGAKVLGSAAEELELAAKAGDIAFVRGRSGAFIDEIEAFLASLSAFLGEMEAGKVRPRKPAPDPEVLAALREACENFDMDGLDRAMEKIQTFDYDEGADLVEWLKDQVSISGFQRIAERLSTTKEEN
jgi:signal transduction histidine kinase/CheY-like chemotaxis protein/HPt (histidine-containing phosphotransfer) domain-containing protein